MAVTGRCAFVQAQVGAVVVQSMADPRLGPAALKLLASGYRPEAVLRAFDRTEEGFEYRQVALVNAPRRHRGTRRAALAAGLVRRGRGRGLRRAGQPAGRSVPSRTCMIEAFVRTRGELGDRLIAACGRPWPKAAPARCTQPAS